MASLSHILEQTVPAGKSNQNPAYARASVLTEAAAVCLQIEATPLLKVCLAKVPPPLLLAAKHSATSYYPYPCRVTHATKRRCLCICCISRWSRSRSRP